MKLLSTNTEHNAYGKGRVKLYRVPGPGPSTGGEEFFRKKLGGRRLFFGNRGAKTFLL